MNNAVKIMLGTSSGILIGIGTAFLATLYSQIFGIVMGLTLLISGISGLVVVKHPSKAFFYASATSQVLIGASVFGVTAASKPHLFNFSWSLAVVLLALFSIILGRKHGHA
ncbi:hypothetical protein ACJJIF_13375 [Microbulbifer sp. SSSA002]|uniref:hypothetical protein n=1 Tax=unclassified Microbulbifer TaxID=2619833 RepID=UPI00403A3144